MKPNPEANHPDDDRDLREAELTIGDYKLKMSPNFDPLEENRDTTLKKFKELLEVREQIYNIRKQFNEKVFDLRKEKVSVFKYVEVKKQLLNEIYKELTVQERKDSGVEIEFCTDVEYPERAFELETYLRPQKSMADTFRDEIPPLEVDKLSERQREILSAELPPGEKHTEWELELIAHRHQSQLYEQDRLLTRINLRVTEFNEKVQKLSEERLQVENEGKFLEQYLLTLNQELWVLKDFEQLEEELIIRLEQQIFDRNKIHSDMVKEKMEMDERKRQIAEWEEKQNEIEALFLHQCREDEYWKFFRRIFYKRWKPPKVIDEDEDHEYGE